MATTAYMTCDARLCACAVFAITMALASLSKKKRFLEGRDLHNFETLVCISQPKELKCLTADPGLDSSQTEVNKATTLYGVAVQHVTRVIDGWA